MEYSDGSWVTIFAMFDRAVLPQVFASLVLAMAASAIASAANSAASPLAQGLAHCAEIDASEARLACYDALARANGVAATAVSTGPTSAPPAPAPATVAAAPAASGDEVRNFGLTPVQVHPVRSGTTAIEAHVAAIAANRGDFGQTYLSLDNGETWTTSDDVSRLAVGDAVHIRRAALGSFLLTTPANQSYRVRRVH